MSVGNRKYLLNQQTLNKADARYFIKLISILGKFVDRGRECEIIIPPKEGDEK